MDKLRQAAAAALRTLEVLRVEVDGEWGTGRDLLEIEVDGDQWQEVIGLRSALAEQPAEPVAWAMPRNDGVYIDVITPEEHARCEGEYTVPLYAAPQPAINAALVRAQALEEAAVACEDLDEEASWKEDRLASGHECAAAIRAMKEKT